MDIVEDLIDELRCIIEVWVDKYELEPFQIQKAIRKLEDHFGEGYED